MFLIGKHGEEAYRELQAELLQFLWNVSEMFLVFWFNPHALGTSWGHPVVWEAFSPSLDFQMQD